MANKRQHSTPSTHPAQVAAWIAAAIGTIATLIWTMFVYFDEHSTKEAKWMPGVWIGTLGKVSKDFGDATWCQYALEITGTNINVVVEKGAIQPRSDIGFDYDEYPTKDGCHSGLQGHIKKTLEFANSKRENGLVSIDYKDNSEVSPRVQAHLVGKFNSSEYPPSFDGVLRINRIDYNNPIYNWDVEQEIKLTKSCSLRIAGLFCW